MSPLTAGSEASLTALELARLHRRTELTPGGRSLYQRIARSLELGAASEVLTAPSGCGRLIAFLAEEHEIAGAGVDEDGGAVARARELARDDGLASRLSFEQAPLTDLPYKDAVFDVAIGVPGLAAASDVAAAVRELARATRPMGTVALLQLTWSRSVPEADRARLVEHLGVRPFLLVQWKQMLRDAGVVGLEVDDWSAALDTPRGQRLDVASLGDRLSVYLQAWRARGWNGVRGVRRNDLSARVLAASERVLGLTLIRGTRWA